MSILQKVFFDPKHRKRGLIFAFAIFGICVAVITGTVVYNFAIPKQNFPKLKSHLDLPTQAITTFDDSKNFDYPNDVDGFNNSSCPTLNSDWVAKENAKTGVAMQASEWRQVDFRTVNGSSLWLNTTSAGCGETIQVHAALSDRYISGDRSRTIHAWRIGWYGGAGARDIWSSSPIALKKEKVRQPKDNLRMVDTRWPTTLKIQIGNDWTPGFYLIITEDASGHMEGAAPLVVRAPEGNSPVLLMHSFLTWNLYNSFGSRSAYFGNGEDTKSKRDDRSRVVSLDRPIIGSGGYSIKRDAISMVQFLEKNGINFDQVSDLDINQKPSMLDSYNELVLSGHAEYMTRRIFQSIIAARNHGTNLAIFGGNTALWQTRLTESPVGPNRRIIMYRSSTEDPVSDLRQVSIEFANKRINIPQTLFTGMLPSGTHTYGNYKAVKIPGWMNLPSYSSIDGISPDSEVEATVPRSPASPPNVQIMFAGKMTYADPSIIPSIMPLHPEAEIVWFTNENGQATFNVGLTTWACDLIDTCAYSTVDDKSRAVMDQVTTTVIKLWEKRKVGLTLKN